MLLQAHMQRCKHVALRCKCLQRCKSLFLVTFESIKLDDMIKMILENSLLVLDFLPELLDFAPGIDHWLPEISIHDLVEVRLGRAFNVRLSS